MLRPRTPPARPDSEPLNDYQIDREYEPIGPPLGARLLRLLTYLLLMVLALLSFALFWVIAKLLNLL
ncbi:MAG: hypothetical protein JO267_13840 [Alphaproteobacteria bacterium]|nr:hypothetical protein [Alphaproteobacteria bacterium]